PDAGTRFRRPGRSGSGRRLQRLPCCGGSLRWRVAQEGRPLGRTRAGGAGEDRPWARHRGRCRGSFSRCLRRAHPPPPRGPIRRLARPPDRRRGEVAARWGILSRQGPPGTHGPRGSGAADEQLTGEPTRATETWEAVMRLKGFAAIEYAEKHNLKLHKKSDST